MGNNLKKKEVRVFVCRRCSKYYQANAKRSRYCKKCNKGNAMSAALN